MNNNFKWYAFFGHHKAASTWVHMVLKDICTLLEFKYGNFHSPKVFKYNLEEALMEKGFDFFGYTNADIHYVKPILDRIKGFHIIRDPRDIVVSAYFSHLKSHGVNGWPELVAHRKKLQSLTKEDGILSLMDDIDNVKLDGDEVNRIGLMDRWDYSLPNILEVKFEDLISNPYVVFMKVLEFLEIVDDSDERSETRKCTIKEAIRCLMGLTSADTGNEQPRKIHFSKALEIIYKNDFEVITKGRKPGDEDLKSHYRKGEPGDWMNHFTDKHKRVFKEKYGDLLIKLGYEEDMEW